MDRPVALSRFRYRERRLKNKRTVYNVSQPTAGELKIYDVVSWNQCKLYIVHVILVGRRDL